MIKTVSEVMGSDPDTVLLLVDIGVWGFRDVLEKHKQRAKNVGIFEPGTVSLAAGLALMGMTPTIYGITPFIVQRSLEQLKLDFIYQKLGGNFITTGASYDFPTLGYSHYCPEDVATLLQLPGMEIVTPGTPAQFETLYRESYNNGRPTYFRLIDDCNKTEVPVTFGKANVIRTGSKATVLTFADTLDVTLTACEDFDVTVLYYATAVPFDGETLRENCVNCKVLICEPFYMGTMYPSVIESLKPGAICIDSVGVPREVLRNYGTKKEKDEYCGITAENIRRHLSRLIGE